MDSNERLTALKKAYADIILNTAKEAAARIMVSERKALRFQHELHVAKEEALQMLLRLKQMMESKITEAEMKSSSQQRKIEELEAQLQEAEDIVRDLREELREVQAELETTNDKLQHLNELGTTHREGTSDEKRPYNSQFTVFSPPELQYDSIAVSEMENFTLNQRNEGHKCCSANGSCMGNSYVAHHDLPSIILRRKEHELYRNGCTQRIRAFERNMLDGESYISREIDDVKNVTGVREDEEGEGICTALTHKADNICSIEKKLVDADNNWYRVQDVKSFPRKRKRATRYKTNRTPSCRYLPDQVLERDETSDISYSKTNSSSINNKAQSGKGQMTQMPPRLLSGATEASMQSRCADVTENEVEFVKACTAQNRIDKDKVLIDKLVVTRQESGSLESSGIPVCRVAIEKVDVPLVQSESKPSETTNMISSQPVPDRIIKYTFQRRKKESVSSDGNASLEKGTLMGETEEKQNGSLGPKKSSSVTESSRDSRRLAQVARQLISMSEKKWWQ
ncbi:uncharacterized protein LOC132284262 [Cornus florida]|uniref:uncharacterized protein LOC132284262 n=1 Tax=Cornus florida TaxID=4283 RepID=UPI00289B100C|nr:uncharacterized protein LOC132284262 [Cornus florida]